MPRSGVLGTYSLPPGTTPQQPNTVIQSAMFNAFAEDVQQTNNTPTPIAYGGSGTSTPVGAADAFSTKGADIASASTTNIWAATGEYVHITGTTNIASFGSSGAAGNERTLVFDGSLSISYGASSILTPNNLDIVVSPGDSIVLRSEGGTLSRIVSVTKSGGWESVGSGSITPAGVTSVPITGIGGFRKLRISGWLVVSTADGIGLQFSNNNGVSWLNGASDYRRVGSATVGTALPVNISSSGPIFFINSVQNQTTGEICDFSVEIDNPVGGRIVSKNRTFHIGAVTGEKILTDSGCDTAFLGAVNALRFYTATGTSTLSGFLAIEGVK